MIKMKSIKIKELMTPVVVTVNTKDSVNTVAQIMKKHKIRGVVVVEESKPIGIITDKDIITKIIAENKNTNEIVKNIMSNELITSSIEESLVDVSKKMAKYKIGRIPILDENGKLVGIVTETDMTRVYPNLVEILNERLKQNPRNMYYEKKTTNGNCEVCDNFSENLIEINGKWVCEGCSL